MTSQLLAAFLKFMNFNVQLIMQDMITLFETIAKGIRQEFELKGIIHICPCHIRHITSVSQSAGMQVYNID